MVYFSRFGLLVLLAVAGARPSWAAPVTVSGQVVNAAGQPLPGATVLVRGYDQQKTSNTTPTTGKTDEEGKFAFLGIEPGISVSARTRLPVSHVYVFAYSPPLALTWVDVTDQAVDLKLTCAAAQPIAGRVVGPDGKGLPATVKCYFLGGRRVGGLPPVSLNFEGLQEFTSVHCDPEGNFIFPWTPPDVRTSLSVRCAGYGERMVQPNALPVTISLQASGRLDLQFTCPDKPDAVAGLWVQCDFRDMTGGGRNFRNAMTDVSGHVLLDNAAPGTYELRVAQNVDLNWRAYATDIVVKSSETTKQTIPLQRTIQVTGRVLDADSGQPVAGVQVADDAAPPFNTYNSTTTDAQGHYSIMLLPGATTLSVWANSDRNPQGYRAAPRLAVTVAAGTPLPDLKASRGGPGGGGLPVVKPEQRTEPGQP